MRAVLLFVVGLVASTLAAPDRAAAQPYPSRPITMVVAFAAGGSGDTIARILAEHMGSQLGQTVVVENVGGAAGSIGVGRVARSTPDGYTISFGNWPTHVLNGAVYSLTYDVLNDFEPISLIATESIAIVGKKAMPANNLKELIAWLKANPDKASAGTTGPGGVGHVIGVFFQKETGTRFQFVPYRGVGPAMQDLVAGQIDVMFDTSANSLPQVRAGTIKGYAVTSKTRLPAAPDIRPSTKRDCRASTSRTGVGCGRRKARRGTSSSSSTLPSGARSRPRRSARGSPISVRSCCRPTSSRRRRSARCRRPRSRNGGRSSGLPTSRRSSHTSTFSAAMKASCGMSTLPYWRMRFLPSFCFSSSLRLRVMSPP